MSQDSSGGIAGRVGRWSARHKKTAILGWLALIALTVVLGGQVVKQEPTDAQNFNGESRQAEELREEAGFPQTDKPTESILVKSQQHTASDPEFRSAVRDLETTVKAQKDVKRITSSPYAKNGAISEDGHAALIELEMKGSSDDAANRVAPLMAAVKTAAGQHPEVSVGQFGAASIDKQLADTEGKDFQKVEQLSLPITALILLIAFGALVAAGVPLLLALTAIGGTMGMMGVLSQIVPLTSDADSLVFLIGLAVGVDYSLFYVRREREERAKGHDKMDSIAIAAATSGRAVLVSGITVIIAMAGMFLTNQTTFMGMGLATIAVVAFAVAGSLTVLPATLALLGDKINKGRIPFLGRKRTVARESRVWGWMVTKVMRRPLVAVIVAGGALVALSLPALGMQTKLSGFEDMPKVSSVQALLDTKKAFPSEADPASVVVKADSIDAPKVKAAIADFTAQAEKDPQVAGTVGTEINPARDVAVLSVGLPGTGTDDASQNALEHLRGDLIPSTLDKAPGVTTAVSGGAAANADFNDLMSTKTPLVFAFVLTFAFLLLLISFRSIVIAFKALVLNLLSVGAAYGVLVAVFQWGWLDWIGYSSPGYVDTIVPALVLAVTFGLSMDYEVFLLTRIRERYAEHGRNDEAVAEGLVGSARIITSAALVMVAVFAAFAVAGAPSLRELGVGLAVAIGLDATIVRLVVVPATMRLLGDWNWWVPRRLARLWPAAAPLG
jgi:uncharacterized membrane protein YdfJ with MMPL/SSD domain